jgi:mono/diheme cytochrome c family protein
MTPPRKRVWKRAHGVPIERADAHGVTVRRPRWRSPAPLLIGAALSLSCATACGGGGSGSSTPTPKATATAKATSTPATSAGAVARGKALYASKGCQSCHSIDGSPRTGPTWKGLAGSSVKLTNGRTVKAGDAYLMTSIEDPDKQIVSGYQRGVMSSTIPKGSISTADAKALVAYIDSLR